MVYCGKEVSVLGVDRGDLVEDFAWEKHDVDGWWYSSRLARQISI